MANGYFEVSLKPSQTPLTLSMMILIWGAAVGLSISLLMRYSATPGSDSRSPLTWPVDVDYLGLENTASLLVFIHPKCACTFASLSEFERLAVEVDEPFQTVFLVDCPKSNLSTWEQSSVVKRCQSILSARVVIDIDGNLAKKFNATTSGYCLLYSEGRLAFQGGITSERGHEGESLGRGALREILRGRSTTVRQTPVFGCELFRSHQDLPLRPVCCMKEES